MRTGRLGGVLLGIGAAVGVAAVVGLVVGFEPARLPPALINIAVYKLTAAAAIGLLAAGAIIRRYDKREQSEAGARRSSLPESQAAPALPAADPSIDLASRQPAKEAARAPKRPD
jgi:hypothetical protein